MAKRYLDVNGIIKDSREITYNELIWLFNDFIAKNDSFPTYKQCKSENNLPNQKIIASILKNNNINRTDFYKQFGKYGEEYCGYSIVETDSWMIEYIKGGYNVAKNYTSKSNKKIMFKCPYCKHEFKRAISYVNKYGFHCQCCDDGISYPNKFSYELLNQLKDIYELKNIQHEYSPNWVGRRRYDNYFEYNNKSYILEMDGGFHKNGIYTTSPYGLEERQNIDIEKDELARKHNIDVIRIDCEPSTFENIKTNIIKSKMSLLFDISIIDWDKCNLFAMHNIVKKVCDRFNENPNLTTNDLGKIFGLYATTIASYLKKGTTLGWCNYNPDYEARKFQALKFGHKIDIYDTDTDIHYKFNSIRETKIKTKELFGKSISDSTIAKYKDTGIKYKHFIISSIKEVD